MRVLKNMVLVKVTSDNTNPLVSGFDHVRTGDVYVSGSDQIKSEERVLFGDDFEAIELPAEKREKYYLMHEQNIKIIYGPDDKPPKANVLSFMRSEAA